jgi:hypothetical protein
MNRRLFFYMLSGAMSAKGKSQNHTWQKGELVGMDVQRIPITAKKMRYRYTYTIHGAGHSYVFDDRAKLNLTINGPVEYAVEGDKIFVRDESGREQRETILQKAVDKPDQ